MQYINSYVLPYLSFYFIIAIYAVIIQFLKVTVWTEKRATTKTKTAVLFWWGRKTLSLQALALGMLTGLIPTMPIGAGMDNTITTRVLYYGTAGVLSAFAFDVVKGLGKKRKIKIQLPGLNEKDVPCKNHELHKKIVQQISLMDRD